MGINLLVGGFSFEATSYSVEEDATPIDGGSGGGVGAMRFTVVAPDPHAPHDGTVRDGWTFLRDFGPTMLYGESVSLRDSRQGRTFGRVRSITDNGNGTFDIDCLSTLGRLLVHNVYTEPYTGTLGGAIQYYLSIANIIEGFTVDPTISGRHVDYPAWGGDLWEHFKMMCAAEEIDMSLVGGEIVFRPVRKRIALSGRDVTLRRSVEATSAAKSIEVYNQQTRPITNKLVYPVGDPRYVEDAITVPAGATIEVQVELNASVASLVPPFPVDIAPMTDYSQSLYSVTGDDGQPVSAAQWSSTGGRVDVSLNPDGRSATLTIKGGQGRNRDQTPIRVFSFSRPDNFGGRYSTLRILGTGVRDEPIKETVATGAYAADSETEVGVTINNPFATNRNKAYGLGLRAARNYRGYRHVLSGEVLSVSRLGDSQDRILPTVEEVETWIDSQIGTSHTVANVKSLFAAEGITTAGEATEFFASQTEDDFTNQVYGNVTGARIWDEETRRWYRITSASISAGPIQYTAEDDLTVGDVNAFYAGKSCGNMNSVFAGFTAGQVAQLGLYSG